MRVDLSKFDFKSSEILSSLSESNRKLVIESSEKLSFKKGKLIFYEGGIPTGAFLLEGGKAKIYKTGLDGKDQIFYIYKKGELLGYHALLCNETYEDSCEAIEDCEIRFISSANFVKLTKSIPELQTLLIQNMSHEFGVLVNVITVMAQKPVRERLALFLLLLSEKYDDQGINLSRDDLANLTGTARESLGRLLKEMKEDRLVEIDGRVIRLTNQKGIMKIAKSDYS